MRSRIAADRILRPGDKVIVTGYGCGDELCWWVGKVKGYWLSGELLAGPAVPDAFSGEFIKKLTDRPFLRWYGSEFDYFVENVETKDRSYVYYRRACPILEWK